MSHEDLIVSGQCHDKFEKLIAKAAIIFDLKELLTCCSIPAEERIIFEISLVKTKSILSRIEIPSRKKPDSPRQPTLDFNEVLLHGFMNPAEASLALRDALPEEAKPVNDDDEVKYKLTFSFGSESRTLFSTYRRCPIIICCWY